MLKKKISYSRGMSTFPAIIIYCKNLSKHKN